MTAEAERPITWAPSEAELAEANLTGFLAWLREHRGLAFDGYRDLWRWSVDDLSGFWDAVREHSAVIGEGFEGPALTTPAEGPGSMPGAVWYPGARLNFAENVLRHAHDPAFAETTAIVEIDEADAVRSLSWAELAQRVGALAAALERLGVRPGDRVAAVLPNVPEAIIGMLASAAIGAVWAVNSPDLSADASLNRLRQLEPKVLFGVTGYRFNGADFDCSEALARIEEGLPSITRTILVDTARSGAVRMDADTARSGAVRIDTGAVRSGAAPTTARASGAIERSSFDELIRDSLRDGATAPFRRVPFDHPLWVLFSSGTTGAPKGIVHGQGGMLLESLKMMGLNQDLRPGDLYYVAANTSWMIWNTLISALATGASIVCYAGSPTFGGADRQFRIIDRLGVTFFVTGAAYLSLLERSGLRPGDELGLERLRSIMSTGSPLPDSTWLWVHDAVKRHLHLGSDSGGTDICSGFLGSNPLEPVRLGLLQGPMLAVAAEAWNEEGRRVIDEVGELVITRPLPSMPLCFWGDESGEKYRAAYFEGFPGVWTHGDWITETAGGGFAVHGRSDATLNRGGVRMGSADVYAAMQYVPGVRDSLIIGVERPNGEYRMPLFVTLAEGVELDDELRELIKRTIREHASARHVPDEIVAVPAIPVTHAGKKIEVQIKKLFMGADPERAVSRGALANPEAVDWFVEAAARFRAE